MHTCSLCRKQATFIKVDRNKGKGSMQGFKSFCQEHTEKDYDWQDKDDVNFPYRYEKIA